MSQSVPDSSSPAAGLLDEYLAMCEKGLNPDPQIFAARDPEHAAEFLEALAALEDIDRTLDDQPWPDRLGDYQLIREIGRGGMGIVYEAQQVGLGRRVALKVLPAASMMDSKHVRRFEREATAAAQLNHPNIVPVFAVGKEGGVHYYTMQFVEGVSLGALLRAVRAERARGADATIRELQKVGAGAAADAAPPAEDAQSRWSRSATSTGRAWFELVARWIAAAADAVEHSHQEGVLHRDLKPANLLLDRKGHLWVSDFGLAHVLSRDKALTRSGEFLGTLAYCSPEQAAGRATHVDHRADVYSLGVTLYQLTTFRLPFEDHDRGALLNRILHDEPVRPRRRNPAIPADLETIALKAMAKEPAHRYQSAADLAVDLRAFLSDEPIRARPLTVPQRLWRWCRRNPALAFTSGAALLAAGVGAVVAFAAVEALHQRDLAQTAAARADLFAALANAEAAARTGEPGQRLESLARLRTAADQLPRVDLGTEADTGILQRMRRTAVTAAALWDAEASILGLPEESLWPRMDASRDRVAATLKDGSIAICSIRGGAVTTLGCVASGLAVDFGPDGRFLLVHGGERDEDDWFDPGNERHVVDLETDRLALTWEAGMVDTFLGNGTVLTVDGGFRTRLGNPRTGVWSAGPEVPGELRAFSSPRALTPLVGYGPSVVWNDFKKETWIWRLDDGTCFPLPGPDDFALCFAELSNGHLAAANLYGQLWVSDLERREILSMREVHAGTVTRIATDALGTVVATGSWDGTARLWDSWLAEPLLDFPFPVVDLRVGRSGHGFELGITADLTGGGFRSWRLSPPPALTTFHAGDWPALDNPAAALHPGGRLLALTVRDGVAFADLATGARLGRVHVAKASGLEFAADGKALWVDCKGGLAELPLSVAGGEIRVEEPRWRLRAKEVFTKVAGDAVQGVAIHEGEHHQAFVLDRQRGAPRWLEGEHARAGDVTMSPDRRWLVAGNWNGFEVSVYDLESGGLAARLPAEPAGRVAFCPDGSRLTVLTSEAMVDYEPATWNELRRQRTERPGDSPGRLCYSGDGELLLVFYRKRCDVLRTRDWAWLFDFPLSNRGNVYHPHFSHDGRYLVAASMPNHAQIWDFVELRYMLRDLGLDWDSARPLPPRVRGVDATPLRLILPE